MTAFKPEALVVGHICLDIIPTFLTGAKTLGELLVPGKLINVGDAVMGTGGAASNTGLALHRLGFATGIAGKVGDDIFGGVILDLLRRASPRLADNMIIAKGEGTSYSIVISPPGIDRLFLHAPATNDTFGESDLPDASLEGVRLVHFGYPPLMRKFYVDDGEELKTLFARARAKGATTSLDMARPDPDGPSGRVDWPSFFRNVLPTVDVFLPSVDELIYMLDRNRFDALSARAAGGNLAAFLEIDEIRDLADSLLAMGAAMVCLKLGDEGFYLKTASDPERLASASIGAAAPRDAAAWCDREITTACRRVEPVGTVGAGDCTIAGFLGALLKGLSPDKAVSMATAVGGASVESRDATGGVPPWEEVERRLAAGWPRTSRRLAAPGWRETPEGNLSRGDL